MGFGGGKCNWENADVGSLSIQTADLQCGGGAHPPACHSHTHSRTDIPGESVAQLINFRSVTCVVVPLSSKPHLHLLFARVKKRFLSHWYTLGALRTRGGRASERLTRKIQRQDALAFLRLFWHIHWLAGLCPLAFCYRTDCCRQRHARKIFLDRP